jgi:hypothetical protein
MKLIYPHEILKRHLFARFSYEDFAASAAGS